MVRSRRIRAALVLGTLVGAGSGRLNHENSMKYDLEKPCNLCPFRNDDKRLHVATETLRGMASGEFCCHKTGESNDETDSIEPTPNSQHCAGALIMLEKMGAPHQMMRICERLGMYDRTKLDMSAPVFGSFSEVERASSAGRGGAGGRKRVRAERRKAPNEKLTDCGRERAPQTQKPL
jgi:hypothetical protein